MVSFTVYLCQIFLSHPRPRAPVERMRLAKRRMDALKASPEAYLQLHLNQFAASVLPRAACSQTMLDIMTKHSMVFTNVPGARA